jgi:6-phosphogluconolactonase
VGSYSVRGSRGIYAYTFDADTGTLFPLGLKAESVNPSFVLLAPDGKALYAVSEVAEYKGQSSGSIRAYRVDAKTGDLQLINEVASGGAGPCYLAFDKSGSFLLAANYGGGSVAAFPILSGGKIGEASGIVEHHGSSSNPERQAKPHPHAIETTFDNRFAIAADLGLDQLLIYKFDTGRGQLLPADSPFAKVHVSSGPRHFAFHPNRHFLYLVNEIDSSVSVFAYHSEGTLAEKQTISALPAGFVGQSDAADIEISPSGNYLYVSNRGAENIGVFGIDTKTGMLMRIETVPSGGRTPHLKITPNGKFLAVANENSDNVVAFRIDEKSGRLKKFAQIEHVASPVSFAFLDLG